MLLVTIMIAAGIHQVPVTWCHRPIQYPDGPLKADTLFFLYTRNSSSEWYQVAKLPSSFFVSALTVTQIFKRLR